jgi:hypothetical protein
MLSGRDTTVSHFHTDPKLISQVGCKFSLKVGRFIYLDADGIYKLALSSASEIESNIQGYVWSFLDNDNFYLKSGIGPASYRFPLEPDFFDTDINGHVIENQVNALMVPGALGDRIWLSETVPGAIQSDRPSSYPVSLGFKTEYGFMYRPDVIFCCVSP